MKKGLKKVIAVASAVTMLGGAVGALAACNPEPKPEETGYTSSSDAEFWGDVASNPAADKVVSTPDCSITVKTGDELAEKNTDFTQTTKSTKYTLKESTASDGSQLDFNPHTWQTNDDSYVLDYISIGFYGLKYTYDNGYDATTEGAAAHTTGYEWTTEMASAFPQDVTSDYVGKFNIKDNDSGKAWKITLNEKACWQDGTAITADDYIYSMQQQLDPAMLNRRADSYTLGTSAIVGANDYFCQGRYVYNNMIVPMAASECAPLASFKTAEDGHLMYQGYDVGFNVNDLGNWGDGSFDAYFGDEVPAQYTALKNRANSDGYVQVTKADYILLSDMVAMLHGHVNTSDYFESDGAYAYLEVQEALYLGKQYATYSWDNVGLKKLDTYELLMVLNNSVSDFDIKYTLTGTWLVNKTIYDAKKDTANKTSGYGKDVASISSYGPYILKSYQKGKELQFEYNPNWYGYSDGKHNGMYQTTNVICEMGVAQHATEFNNFLLGNYDSVGLASTEFDDYKASARRKNVPETYTSKLSINGDLASLQARDTATENHSVLSNKKFREAIALCIDRTTFVNDCVPSARPGYGLLNYLYCIDPDTGALYREQEAAKIALLEVYGFERDSVTGKWNMGLGQQMDTEEAYESQFGGANQNGSFSGANITKAKELFNEAYTEMNGTIFKAGQKVKVSFELYMDDTGYRAIFNAIAKNVNDVIKDTGFGEIQFDFVVGGEYYYDHFQAGTCDMILSTWGGNPMGPQSVLFECYLDPTNSFEKGYDAISKNSDHNLTITTSKGEMTATLWDWAAWLDGKQDDSDYTSAANNLSESDKLGVYAKASKDDIIKIAAIVEKAILSDYYCVPLYYRNSAVLLSGKVEYGSDAYIQLLGLGGVQYLKYNYDDVAWDKIVTNYKAENTDFTNYYKSGTAIDLDQYNH